jgi:hypothetical protein
MSKCLEFFSRVRAGRAARALCFPSFPFCHGEHKLGAGRGFCFIIAGRLGIVR